jgi:hypothetical protein
MEAHTALAERDAHVELAEAGDIRTQRRSFTQKVSLWLFVVVGICLLAAAVCIVMFRTGTRDDVPWYYLAIVLGLPSGPLGFFACFARALDDIG